MKIEPFEMERMQSTWENRVEFDMSESGIMPVTLRQLVEMGFDLDWALDTPLGYSQSDGTPELKELLCRIYPGAEPENIEVTNGTSEANFLLALGLVEPGDEVALQVPNYMQFYRLPESFGAKVNKFSLDREAGWQPNWQEFEKAVNKNTRLCYLSNPNNPTGSVLSKENMDKIISRCEETDTLLLADEVYLGAELEAERTPSFWGKSKKVIVTSGLSKAYGIPGVRIGWIVGPPEVVELCWSQHDYITIGPNKLSDRMACTAVKEANRNRLYDRTRAVLKENMAIFREWAGSFGDFFSYTEPVAGAICFLKYNSDIPSLEFATNVLRNQSTLIVPGVHLGMEGYIRIWLGCSDHDYWQEGLRRIGLEINKLRNTV